jgi:3-methyladenine DNA glycosylase/8-oxoguanine DNA glycosylase
MGDVDIPRRPGGIIVGRLDVWPVGDYGVRAGFGRAWGLAEIPTPRELMPLGEPFRPYRSLVAWYCWRVIDDRTAQT